MAFTTNTDGRHDRWTSEVANTEVAFVLEGGRTRKAGPGTFLHVPAGAPHGLRTERPAKLIVITGERGFLDLVRDAGGPAARREVPPPAEPDVERLGAAATRHGIDLLGPLP